MLLFKYYTNEISCFVTTKVALPLGTLGHFMGCLGIVNYLGQSFIQGVNLKGSIFRRAKIERCSIDVIQISNFSAQIQAVKNLAPKYLQFKRLNGSNFYAAQ